MNITESLKNRVKDITVTVDNKSTTKKAAVMLKAKDFDSKELYNGYKSRILELVKTLPNVANTKEETPEYYTARQAAHNALESIAAYLETSCAVNHCKFGKCELRFIVDRSRSALKLAKDGKSYADFIKSESSIQTLIELVYWHKLNGIALPSAQLAISTQTKIAKQSEKDAKNKKPETVVETAPEISATTETEPNADTKAA